MKAKKYFFFFFFFTISGQGKKLEIMEVRIMNGNMAFGIAREGGE